MNAVTDLSSLVVDEGGVSTDRLDDALQRQVLSGGGLDTVLLEMGLVDENTLLRLLARSEGLPAVDREGIETAGGAAVRLFPRRLAEKHAIVPLALEGRTLSVAVARKPDLALLDEIGFMLSVYVKPFVTTEARIAHALYRLYSVPLPPRLENLLGLLGEDPDEFEALDERGEKVNEDDNGEGEDGWSVVSAKMAVPTGGLLSEDGPARPAGALLGGDGAADGANGEAPGNGAEPEAAKQRLLDHLAREEAEEREREERRRNERVDWTVDDAIAELALADTRDDMLDVALRFAYRRLSTVAIFVLLRSASKDGQPSFVMWDVIDKRFTKSDFARLAIPVDAPGCLGQLEQIRSHFLGPLKEDDPLVEAFGRAPRAAVLVPIIVGDVLAGVLYGDGGKKTIPPSSLAELHMVVPRLGKALRNLILRQKKQGVQDEEVAETKRAVTIAPRAEAAEVPVIEVDLEELGGDDEIDGALGDISAASSGTFSTADAAQEPDPEVPQKRPSLKPQPPPIPKAKKKAKSAAPISTAVWSPAPAPGARARESMLLATWRDWLRHETEDADALVGELQLPGDDGKKAASALVAKGLDAMPALARYFPGVLAVHPFGNMDERPSFSEFSDACSCLARLGPELSSPILVGELAHDDRLHRYTAVLGLLEEKIPAALPRLAQRVFDPEIRIAQLALEVMETYRDVPAFPKVMDWLREFCRRGDEHQRRRAMLAAAELKDTGALDHLIQLLGVRPKEVAEEARAALVDITLQDFGLSDRRWRAWAADHAEQPRTRWLIEALSHKDTNLRERAQNELSEVVGETHGYRFDASRKEREHAVQAWLAWWKEQPRDRWP